MPVLGITGGIATGKTAFTQALRQVFPAEYVDADLISRELVQFDPKVRAEIARTFGDQICKPDGEVRRDLLRELVFSNHEERRRLEAILHPRIRERWMNRAELFYNGEAWLCVDIPLLYEADAGQHFSKVAVVACAPETQFCRLRENRGLDESIAEKMMAAQLDLRTKMNQADYLIWNDSSVGSLEAQSSLLARTLRNSFGPHGG